MNTMSEPQEKIDISDLKDTFLECPVCVEHFNQTDKRPRFLHSCLHAFCTQCLHQLLLKEGRGQITCPLCRQVQKVKGNVDSLPPDPVRGKLVDYLQIKHQQRVLCGECEEHDAISRCQECQSYLCKDWDYVHKHHRMTKDHRIVSLEEVLEQPLKTLSKGHFCPIHPKHHLEFYCATEEQLCCVSCTFLDHKGHELLKLEDAASQRKQELEERMKEVHNIAVNLRKAGEKGRMQEEVIANIKSKSLSDINSMFGNLTKVLDQRKRQLEAIVHDKSESLLSVVQKTSSANEHTLAIIESTDTYFSQAKEKADVVELLQMYPSIKRSVEALQEPIINPNFNKSVTDFSFLKHMASEMEQMTGELGAFGKMGEVETRDSRNENKQTITAGADFAVVEGQHIVVKVHKTDITKLELDVIVNGANANLVHAGGVARAISDAGGPGLSQRGNQILSEHGPIKVSHLVVTDPGNLRCKMVFHAVGPEWHKYSDKNKCGEDVCNTILRCLCEATNRGLSTIAFPSISSSIFGVPQELCAQMYVRALKSFDAVVNHGSLKEIHFVDVSNKMVSIIKKELEDSWKELQKEAVLLNDTSFIKENLKSNVGILHSPRDSGSVPSYKIRKSKPEMKFSDKVSLLITKADIMKQTADALVSWEDFTFSTERYFTKQMLTVGGQHIETQRKLARNAVKNVGDIDIRSGGNLPQKYVIFAVMGTQVKTIDLHKVLCKIFKRWEQCALILPVFQLFEHGSGKTKITMFMEAVVDALRDLVKQDTHGALQVHIIDSQQRIVDELTQRLYDCCVTKELLENQDHNTQQPVASGENNCTICLNPVTNPETLKCGDVFCKPCIEEAFKVKKVCPNCQAVCGTIIGNMPKGDIKVRVHKYSVSGYEGYNTIVITYTFHGGTQSPEHPHPGQRYLGTSRTTYLPDTAEGRKVLALLKVAWDRRLTFTVGLFGTMSGSGGDRVTWNEIHHKTSTTGGSTDHGYPDPDYLRRVQEELATRGVTEEDLGATGTSV